MKFKPKEIAMPALILCIICLVVTGALSVTSFITKDKIAQLSIETAKQARTVVLPEAVDFKPADDKESYYIGNGPDGSVKGYVFTNSAKGYAGSLQVMTGINTKGQVTGVTILSLNETPGLGMNAQNAEFTDMYRQPVPRAGFTVIKSGLPENGNIVALTGATITTNAVTEAVNASVQQYEAITKEVPEHGQGLR